MNSSSFHTPSVSSFGLHHKQLTTNAKQSTCGFPHIDYDTDAIMNALSSANEDRREVIYQFVTNLKADLGIQKLNDMFDCFYMFAAPTEADSFINWAQPTKFNCTKVGTGITFLANRGWRQNAISSTSYLNSNFNPMRPDLFDLTNINFGLGNTSSAATNNTGSWGIYINSSPNGFLGGDWWVMGACTSTNGSPIAFSPRNSASFYTYGCMTTGRPGSGVNQFSSAIKVFCEGGLFSCVKPDNSSCELYYNGDLVDKRGASTAATLIRDSGPIIYGNLNYNSTGGTAVNIGLPSTAELKMFSFSYIGSVNIKPDIINRRLNEYFYAINAQSFITSVR